MLFLFKVVLQQHFLLVLCEVVHLSVSVSQENWQHSSGRAVTRDDLMMTLANLESIHIRTIYDNRMASVGLSDISMDTTTKEFTQQGNPRDVEECRLVCL